MKKNKDEYTPLKWIVIFFLAPPAWGFCGLVIWYLASFTLRGLPPPLTFFEVGAIMGFFGWVIAFLRRNEPLD